MTTWKETGTVRRKGYSIMGSDGPGGLASWIITYQQLHINCHCGHNWKQVPKNQGSSKFQRIHEVTLVLVSCGTELQSKSQQKSGMFGIWSAAATTQKYFKQNHGECGRTQKSDELGNSNEISAEWLRPYVTHPTSRKDISAHCSKLAEKQLR